ncbi:hypothetical protein LOK49_LG04G02506 [Camellia lanceoleosa]|uniref:Uncharacterized protein n=1 Tax=Camellia lanceoleosa TaxID=1840588 RepID=A0ACC0HZC5_9ERIC|nr:hypothetical protein LOK49_LG04G02506 [Camellia lanceoleosa]
MANGLNTTPLAEISVSFPMLSSASTSEDAVSVVPSNNATSNPNSEPNINIRALIGSMVAQATSASLNMAPFGDTVREVIVNHVVQPSVSSLGSAIIDHFFVQRQNFNRRVAIMLFVFMVLLLLQRKTIH